MVKAEEKIKRIKRILSLASKRFKPMNECTNKNWNDLERNFFIYAKALEEILLITLDEKEIWARCPYCHMRFTKVVSDREKKRIFWCEGCKK